MQRILNRTLDDYLFRMYNELLMQLQQEEHYKDLLDEVQNLESKFPIIREIFEGENIGIDYNLSCEERSAIKKYVELRLDMQDDLQIKYYLRGFHDFLILLFKCDILGKKEMD